MATMTAAKAIEEAVGTIPDLTVKLEDIPGSECEKRALEVALAGGHSIAILYNEGATAPQLIRSGVRLAQEVPVPFHGIADPWCPCGNYGSPKVECRCSAKVIRTHLSKLGKRLNEFTIWIGASIPLARYMDMKGEPETAILKRIQTARAASASSDELDSSCREMIDCYLKGVSVSLDVAKVKAIAQTIARLDGQSRLLVQHVAEALQYQPHALPGFRAWALPTSPERSVHQ
jgi:predicted ATPase with chaperone activity